MLLFMLVENMTPEEYAKSIGIKYTNHYPGLECPNCSKWGVIFIEMTIG